MKNKIKIAYLGPKATFSHQAAIKLFDSNHKLIPAKNLEEVFKLTRDKKCHKAIIPIENSNAGTVSDILNIFCRKDYKLKITNELFLKINFHLLSNEKNIKNIKLIYAHPMAIQQCNNWLKKNLKNIKIEKVNSNSIAAKLSSENKNTGAISNELSSEVYKIPILKNKIQDYDDNTTRFLVLANKTTGSTRNDKTSLLFSLKHKSGVLYKFLEPLAKKKINLIKIESRIMRIPIKNKINWEYHFFLDIEGHKDDKKIKEALQEMRKHCLKLKILGSYPRGVTPWK